MAHIMTSNSKLDLGASRHLPTRDIPANYKGNKEAEFTLRESGWVNLGFDVSSEEEAALNGGQLAPGIYIPSQNIPPSPEPARISTYAQAASDFDAMLLQAAPANFFDLTESLSDWSYDSPDASLNAEAPVYDYVPYYADYSEKYTGNFEGLYTPQSHHALPVPASIFETPCTPARHPNLYLQTPELSPDGSDCSEAETDWESELGSSDVSRASSSEPLANALDLDLNYFSKPETKRGGKWGGQGNSLPQLFSQSQKPQAPAAGPSSIPWQRSLCEFSVDPGSPSPGPSRTTTTRSKRKANPTPYARRTPSPVNFSFRTRTANPVEKPSSNLKCDVCGYVQMCGPGDMRSYKRHLQTHPQYRVLEWYCRGKRREDGTYDGGCGNQYARKDALQRHVKSANNDCISDFRPVIVLCDNAADINLFAPGQ